MAWTKAHRLVLLVAWLGWTFDVMDAAIFNLAKPQMVKEFLGSAEAYAAHGASVEAQILNVFLIGWSIGGVLFGWAADRFGRVRVLAFTVLLYSVFTGLTALCRDAGQVAVLRFLAGLGIGGEWAAGAALVAESVPESTRAKAAAWLQTAAVVGPVLAAVANLALAEAGWRALFLVGSLPAVFAVVARLALREPAAPASDPQEPVHGPAGPWPWKRMGVALVLGTAGIAMAQNVSFWLPNFVNALSPGVTALENKSRMLATTMSFHVGTLIGVFLVPWLCDRLGRRKALLLCFLASPLMVVFVAMTAKSYVSLLMLAPLMSVFSIGIGAGFVLYFPELFPRAFRATGAGLAYNGGRILAGLFPLLTAQLIQGSKGDVAKSIAQTSVVLAVGALALLFSPETRGQRLPA
ncbi:MAG: MFS transporter [Armatimonadetes bacterium]|nr:MFS transporter [Armatimonadota bacterium]